MNICDYTFTYILLTKVATKYLGQWIIYSIKQTNFSSEYLCHQKANFSHNRNFYQQIKLQKQKWNKIINFINYYNSYKLNINLIVAKNFNVFNWNANM